MSTPRGIFYSQNQVRTPYRGVCVRVCVCVCVSVVCVRASQIWTTKSTNCERVKYHYKSTNMLQSFIFIWISEDKIFITGLHKHISTGTDLGSIIVMQISRGPLHVRVNKKSQSQKRTNVFNLNGCQLSQGLRLSMTSFNPVSWGQNQITRPPVFKLV